MRRIIEAVHVPGDLALGGQDHQRDRVREIAVSDWVEPEPDRVDQAFDVERITGMEGDIIQMQEIFVYKRTGILPGGKVQGEFSATGVRPRFMDELEAQGITFPGDYFDPDYRPQAA